MTRLADRLTGLIDPEEVIQVLLTSLDDLFRPDGIALFLSPPGGKGPYRPRLAGRLPGKVSGAAGLEPGTNDLLDNGTALEQDSGLAIILNRIRRPVFAEELEDHLFAGDTDAESLKILTRVKAALLVPMIAGNRLLGFLAFGPKSSGALAPARAGHRTRPRQRPRGKRDSRTPI